MKGRGLSALRSQTASALQDKTQFFGDGLETLMGERVFQEYYVGGFDSSETSLASLHLGGQGGVPVLPYIS